MIVRGLIHFLSALFVTWLYWPGIITPDSAQSFGEARSGVYADPQPPFFAFYWKLLFFFTEGPQPLLAANNFFFWTGLFLISEFGLRRCGAAWWWTLVCGLIPPLFANLGTIWKDVTLLSFFSMCVGLLFYAGAKNSRSAAWLALPFILLVALTRYNAVTTVIPLCFAHLIVLRAVSGKKALSPLLLVIAGAAYVILASQAAAFIQRSFTNGETLYPAHRTLTYEVVAISVGTGANLLPAEWQHYSMEELQSLYTPEGNVRTFFTRSLWPPLTPNPYFIAPEIKMRGRPVKLIPFEIKDAALFARIRAAWWKAVTEHPSEYLRHKLRLLRSLLGIGMKYCCYPYHDTYIWNLSPEHGFQGAPKESLRYSINRFLTLIAYGSIGTVLFRGWFYFLLCLAALFLLLKTWRAMPDVSSAVFLALPVAGILNVLVLAAASPSCDFRYILPTVFGALITFPLGAHLTFTRSSARK